MQCAYPIQSGGMGRWWSHTLCHWMISSSGWFHPAGEKPHCRGLGLDLYPHWVGQGEKWRTTPNSTSLFPPPKQSKRILWLIILRFRRPKSPLRFRRPRMIEPVLSPPKIIYKHNHGHLSTTPTWTQIEKGSNNPLHPGSPEAEAQTPSSSERACRRWTTVVNKFGSKDGLSRRQVVPSFLLAH